MKQNRMKAINENLEFVRNALADLRPKSNQEQGPETVGTDASSPGWQDTDNQPVVRPCGRILPKGSMGGAKRDNEAQPVVADVLVGRIHKALSTSVGELISGGYIVSDQERSDLNDCVSDLVNAATTWIADMCPWTKERTVCRQFVSKMEHKE